MKRGILIATLIVTAAGVASANLLTEESRTASQPTAVPRYVPPPAEASAPPALTQGSVAAIRTSIKQEPAKASQKVSVEARQAPVPLQVKPRATAKLPTIDALISAQSADAKDQDKDAEQAAAEPAVVTDDGFSEAKAKAAIEADGYKGVTMVRKGDNGTWRAKAMRGKTEVMLTVDASGAVAAD